MRLLLAGLAIAAAAAQQAPQRTIVVVSDMHMSGGHTAGGGWASSEDFRWGHEFAAFLRALDTEGGVDLVLNGDTFDLLEAPAIDRVVAAHQPEIEALGAFARSGRNRLFIIPGDHDRDVASAPVADVIRRALQVPSDRVTFATSGYWVSSDGLVYAEHGHTIGFRGEQPDGARAAFQLSRRLEERYPAVDNVVRVGTGLRYAVTADATVDLGDDVRTLLPHLLFNIAWQQFRMELDDGEVQPPVWDLTRVRAEGPPFLVGSLPDDDPLKAIAERAAVAGRLEVALAGMSDDELTMLCDYRAAVRRARRRFEPTVSQFVPRGPVVTECPRTPETRGAIFDYFWRSRDELYGRYARSVVDRLRARHPPVVFVHGHTHLPDRAQSGANMISGGLLTIPMEGFSPVRGAVSPVVINGGAWQRTITPVQLERLHAERGMSWDALLRSLHPEALAPCYSFVLVPPYTDAPKPAVRYWRESAGGEWSFAAGCDR